MGPIEPFIRLVQPHGENIRIVMVMAIIIILHASRIPTSPREAKILQKPKENQ